MENMQLENSTSRHYSTPISALKTRAQMQPERELKSVIFANSLSGHTRTYHGMGPWSGDLFYPEISQFSIAPETANRHNWLVATGLAKSPFELWHSASVLRIVDTYVQQQSLLLFSVQSPVKLQPINGGHEVSQVSSRS